MKKSIKSIIAVCIAVVLVGTVFAACSSSNSETNGTYKVGIAQWEDHPALNDATEGFKKHFRISLVKTRLNLNTIPPRARLQTVQLSLTVMQQTRLI